MKVTLNLRSGIGPVSLDLPGDDEEVLDQIKKSLAEGEILDLTDAKGDRLVIPADAIGYVLVPATQSPRVGFGRN